MHHIDKARTGEECPFCHKGRLFPTGESSVERNDRVQQGETGRSERWYECDTCGKKTNGVGTSLRENLALRDTSVRATSGTETEKKE